jgi:ribosomal protein S18 acetylase RimI-like enzyme
MTKSNPSLAPALSGEVLLFGQIHETCAKLIREAVTGVGAQPPVCGIDAPYIKYLFKPSTLPALRDLPEGLRWGEVRKQDFALVRSRTSIPRQDATLALLPSLAVFPEDQHGDVAPVAWAFLGVDGSLTSLHTEPEYRGKGLAKVLTGKLFREGGFRGKSLNGKLSAEKSEVFGSDEDWFHGDVALDNKSSRGVCEGLGGKTSWIVYWIRIDLTKAQNVTS